MKKIKELINKLLNYPVYLLSGFFSLYIALFYSSHNADSLTVSVLITNIALIVIFSLLITKIALWVFKSRIFLSFTAKKRSVYIASFIFVLFAYYMRFPIYGIIALLLKSYEESTSILELFSTILYSITFLIGITLFWLSIFYFIFQKRKEVLLIYLIVLIFPLYKTVNALFTNLSYTSKIQSSSDENEINPKWLFKKKQNVYFLLFDSYTSPKGLEMLGDRYSTPEKTNINPFLEELSQREFYVYDSFYTNFQPTKYAIPSYFGMQLRYKDKYLYDLSLEDREKIMSEEGMVYKIFKKNNYKINIPTYDSLFFRGNFTSQFMFMNKKQVKYFELFDKIVLDNKYGLTFDSPSEIQVLTDMQKSLEFIKKQDQDIHHFTYLHYFRPFHMIFQRFGICNEEIEFLEYITRVHNTNRDILSLIDTIKSVDSNSIIILTSDHGPLIFNSCTLIYSLKTREEVIERQHAFLAIHLGKAKEDSDQSKFKINEIKSSVNLFRYIFAYMTENEEILENKPSDDAFYLETEDGPVKKSINDGQILKKSVKQTVAK